MIGRTKYRQEISESIALTERVLVNLFRKSFVFIVISQYQTWATQTLIVVMGYFWFPSLKYNSSSVILKAWQTFLDSNGTTDEAPVAPTSSTDGVVDTESTNMNTGGAGAIAAI